MNGFKDRYNCSQCTNDVPCLQHVERASDEILNSQEYKDWALSQIPGEVDMSGPTLGDRNDQMG